MTPLSESGITVKIMVNTVNSHKHKLIHDILAVMMSFIALTISAVKVLKLISVFLKNPQGNTVSSENIFPVKGMRSGRYTLPQIARCVCV